MAPLDKGNGHISVTYWPIVIISVCIIRFSMVLSPSERYFVTINNVLTKLQQHIIKYKPY